MTEMTIIRSKYQLWNEFIVEGFKNGLKTEQIRENLIEAVRREVFGQMMNQMRVEDLMSARPTEKNMRIVKNISINTRKKWEALMEMCNSQLQTLNLVRMEDLQKVWPSDYVSEEYEFAEAREPAKSAFGYEEIGDPKNDYDSPWTESEEPEEEMTHEMAENGDSGMEMAPSREGQTEYAEDLGENADEPADTADPVLDGEIVFDTISGQFVRMSAEEIEKAMKQ